MAKINKEQLKLYIGSRIYSNGHGGITGDVHRDTLKDVADTIADAVNDLYDHPTVEVDTTLTQEGEAADAKATGDKIANLGSKVGELSDLQTTDKSNIVNAINEAMTKGGGGIPDAPSDGKQYVRKNNAWEENAPAIDAYSKSESDAKYETKTNASATYATKTEVDSKIGELGNLLKMEESYSPSISWTQDKVIIYNDGTAYTFKGSKSTNFIKVHGYEKVRVSMYPSKTTIGIAFYDNGVNEGKTDKQSYKVGYISNTAEVVIKEYEIPSDVYYMRASWKDDFGVFTCQLINTASVKDVVLETKTQMQDKAAIADVEEVKVITNPPVEKNGTLIVASDGKVADVSGSSTLWKATTFINVCGAKEIIVTMPKTTAASTAGLCFYDSNYQRIQGYVCNYDANQPHVEQETREIQVPQEAKYVRTSIRSEFEDTFSLTIRGTRLLHLKDYIFIASHNANYREKEVADYICRGVNDELIIQDAINAAYSLGGGEVRLSTGEFIIDSFPHLVAGHTAIYIPSSDTFGREIRLVGTTLPYGDSGTLLKVSDSTYEQLYNSWDYNVIAVKQSGSSLVTGCKISVILKNFGIQYPWNQKPICAINLCNANKVVAKGLNLRAYTSGYSGGWDVSVTNPPAVATERCVGMIFTRGSNNGVPVDYMNILATGFHVGFKVGGEHVFCQNLSAIFCVYGYTFGDYNWTDGFNHPIIMVNCCDERNVNLPKFCYCGQSKDNNPSGQEIVMIAFNIERIAKYTPGKVLGNLMEELVPNTFYGSIDYTMQTSYTSPAHSTTMPLWESGHGMRFVSRNATQLLACDTAIRMSYAPNYLQRIWDTTLNKEVICIDTANKTWVDLMGNVVDL